jgi:hypothetical protein
MAASVKEAVSRMGPDRQRQGVAAIERLATRALDEEASKLD